MSLEPVQRSLTFRLQPLVEDGRTRSPSSFRAHGTPTDLFSTSFCKKRVHRQKGPDVVISLEKGILTHNQSLEAKAVLHKLLRVYTVPNESVK